MTSPLQRGQQNSMCVDASAPTIQIDAVRTRPLRRRGRRRPADRPTRRCTPRRRRRTDRDARRGEPAGGPNYLFRRAVVVGGVVAVLATASIVVGQLIGSGSEDTDVGSCQHRLEPHRAGRRPHRTCHRRRRPRARRWRGSTPASAAPTASAIVDSTLVVAGNDNVAVDRRRHRETVDEFDLGAEADRASRPAVPSRCSPRGPTADAPCWPTARAAT